MNYKKVIEDYNNGTIDPSMWQLTMDNDDGYWMCISNNIEDCDADELQDMMTEKYGRPDGYRDIVDVLNAAGVTCEWC
jgi:hypothetical protein